MFGFISAKELGYRYAVFKFFQEDSAPRKPGKKSHRKGFHKHSQALWEEESHIDQSPANWYSLCQVMGAIFATGARK